MVTEGEELVCPHHPRDGGYVCMEANVALAMCRKWIGNHNRLLSLDLAVNGDRDEEWVLEHPNPTPDIPTLCGMAPATGWVCTPTAAFEAETAALVAGTLVLARVHLRWEREEELRRQTTPNSSSEQVNDMKKGKAMTE